MRNQSGNLGRRTKIADVYFISDTHFGHRNILIYEESRSHFSSIEEHDEHIIDNWNNIVRKRDTVWHLGDFSFGTENLKIADRLKGIKKLVLGNHDRYNARRYIEHFQDLCGAVTFKKGYVLTHIPVQQDYMARWFCNIHGHLHGAYPPSDRHFCVSAAYVGFKPIPFDVIRERLSE